MFSVFITTASQNGFGTYNPSDERLALLYEAVAQSFVVVGMAISKCSLGFFLLRVAQSRWQHIVIWGTIGVLTTASVATVLAYWVNCSHLNDVVEPVAKVCITPLMKAFIFVAALCMITDVFFALFPWIIFWRLQMPPREKFVVLGSMSLGIIAAIFGVKRTTLIQTMSHPDYLVATVELIAWSAAEVSVTLICIGIPILRPLYKKRLNKLLQTNSDVPVIHPDIPFPLYTIGGSPVVQPPMAALSNKDSPMMSLTDRYSETEERERKIALTGPFNTAKVVGGRKSDEEALVRNQPALRDLEAQSNASSGRIHVVDEFSITTTRAPRV